MAYFSNDEALYNAARDGKYQTVLELFTKETVNLNHKGHNNNTPLHIAAMNGHGAIVQLLIGLGCDRFTKNSNGLTPAQLAKTTKIKNVILYPKRGSTERFEVGWQDLAAFRDDEDIHNVNPGDHWLFPKDLCEEKEIRTKVSEELAAIYPAFGDIAKKLIKASPSNWYNEIIKMYTKETPLYKRMNKDIAAMNKLTKLKFYARELECALRNLQNKSWKGVCYRSVKLSEDKIKLFEKKSKEPYANKISLPSFVSCSKSKQFCLGWGGTLLVIKPNKWIEDYPIDISHLSVFSNEEEVLFSYINQFMVEEVKKVNYANSNTKWEITLQISADYCI